MDREEARKKAEIMMAFANGSDVQFYNGVTKQWEDIEAKCVLFDSVTEYRIKSEPKYRPFRTQEECWNEMHKHPDFGWVRSKQWGSYALIGNIGRVIIRSTDECHRDSMDYIYENYTFTDGTPFGVKEE